MAPRVSVIIPCYNHGLYLRRAVNSVQVQSFIDWEVFIVNDGSTDETAVVAKQFNDPRVCYIHQANAGLSAARNTGIQAAHGKYLAFVDADDEWTPEFLQRCVAVLDADTALAGVYTRNLFIDVDDNVLPQIGGRYVPRARFRQEHWEGGYFPPCAALVRADVIREVGLFDTQLTSEEDWDMWLRIGQSYEMQSIPDPLVRYRVHPGSMSTHAMRMHTNRIAVLSKWFGLPSGNLHNWSDDKRRAYGFAFRTTALSLLQQNQTAEGVTYLTQAVQMWPTLLERLDTFYEVLCASQPNGYRGQSQPIELARISQMVLRWLDEIEQDQSLSGASIRSAHALVYLAMGMLNDQSGHWDQARGNLYRAVHMNPKLLLSGSFMRRLVKLHLGRRFVSRLHKVADAPVV